jgi:purine-binding chemotaxis protein CheW
MSAPRRGTTPTEGCLSVRIGSQWFGIAIDSVIEVLHLVALTELPAAPPDVLGLLTVRRQVMPVIDLRRRFAAGDAALYMDTPLIAVRTAEGPLGLVVDEAADVVHYTAEQVADYESKESAYIRAVIRRPEGLLLMLDVDRLRHEIAARLPAAGSESVDSPDAAPQAEESEETPAG